MSEQSIGSTLILSTTEISNFNKGLSKGLLVLSEAGYTAPFKTQVTEESATLRIALDKTSLTLVAEILLVVLTYTLNHLISDKRKEESPEEPVQQTNTTPQNTEADTKTSADVKSETNPTEQHEEEAIEPEVLTTSVTTEPSESKPVSTLRSKAIRNIINYIITLNYFTPSDLDTHFPDTSDYQINHAITVALDLNLVSRQNHGAYKVISTQMPELSGPAKIAEYIASKEGTFWVKDIRKQFPQLSDTTITNTLHTLKKKGSICPTGLTGEYRVNKQST
ncbi:MAG: hypothetical protein LBL91_02620 [Lachnospiraceae bacterium]|nr:hypothetical protein [Lachnospiraceae bacterium]